jgi:hypothetical protein
MVSTLGALLLGISQSLGETAIDSEPIVQILHPMERVTSPPLSDLHVAYRTDRNPAAFVPLLSEPVRQ